MRQAAQVLARQSSPRPRRVFRHRAVFVRDPLAHSTPLDRNERARLMFLAQRLERRTKERGHKNGALGNVGIEVLRALLFHFANRATGLCFPSYLTLQAMTGRCRGAVAAALRRLESTGIIRVTRRLKRIWLERKSPITGQAERIQVTVQDSNLYAFSGPTAFAARLDSLVETPPPKPLDQLDLLTRLARRLEAESTAKGGKPNLFKKIMDCTPSYHKARR
jgi:hypothetical protein